MKKFKIAVLPGDGIGPEVTNEAIKVLKSVEQKADFELEFEEALVGAEAIFKTGNPLPDETLALCKKSDAVLFGAIGDPSFDNNPDAKVRPEQGLLKLRKELGLYANIRPIKAIEALVDKSPLKNDIFKGTDLVIYRELISGIYFGEKQTHEDYAIDVCRYDKKEIEQIAHLAFKAAQTRRKKVTLVDKANVLDTSRLWRKTCKEIAPQYPDVALDFLFVDNAAMQLVVNPKQFDVVLTENMFGDILSDEGSVITGSIGLLPSASVGEKTGMFEPIHGSYPQAKGQNIANPIASILSASMMLDYLGQKEEAKLVEEGVLKLIKEGVVTQDLDKKSHFSTSDIGNFIQNLIYNEDENLRYFYDENNINIGKSTII